MSTLQLIRKPIELQLREFDQFVAEEFRSDTPLMGEMLSEAISSRGKGIRPILTLLCCAMLDAQGEIGKRAWVAAMMGEMIHLASLIHDDVIDNSPLRRGVPTLNERWQARNAVLTGDYILGRVLKLGLQSGHYDIVTHISDSISTLCEGEVMQAYYASQRSMSMESYLQIVEKKTASLLSICCGAGAMAAGANNADRERVSAFGRAIGVAFQMQDDIIDFAPSEQSGKTQYNDLREGKITLPLLLLLESLSPENQKSTLQLLTRCATDEQAVSELSKLIEKSEAIERAKGVMMSYIEEALALLAHYPESQFRSSLEQLTHFIYARNQ